jgi:hypothetical protein
MHPVAGIAAPDLSTTFLVAAILPLIIGFIVGIIIKSIMKIGLALAILVIILILLGIVTPDQIITPLMGLVKSGPGLTSGVQRLASYLPYSSLTFIVGLAIGFFKG